MIKMLLRNKSHKAIATLASAALAIATYMVLPPGPLEAQQDAASPPASTFQSQSSVQEHAHSDTVHQYSSEAARAHDALLITEVKTALTNDGVTHGQAVVVDCDHGTVTLAGAVASAADAQHAAQVASNVEGVAGVKNKLTW
jgi:osmotically-inducible protein OsmY